MKHLSFFLATLLLSQGIVFSQVSQKDFNAADVVWYGLDFSQAKLVGSAGFTNPEHIRNDFFDSWNSLIMMEASKYDLKGAFRKSDLRYDLEMIKSLNKNVDYTALVQDKTHSIKKEDVESAVKQYNFEQKEGYGISFVVESYDKIQEKAFVWVTIFDAATKNVLVAERIEGKPNGFGLRNYWSGAILRIITEINKVKYKSWIR